MGAKKMTDKEYMFSSKDMFINIRINELKDRLNLVRAQFEMLHGYLKDVCHDMTLLQTGLESLKLVDEELKNRKKS